MTIIWVMVPEIYYFGPFFALLQPKKSKLWKNEKTAWRYYENIIPKIMIGWCTVPEIWCATDEQTDEWTDEKSYI